jgi:hypothetical protein
VSPARLRQRVAGVRSSVAQGHALDFALRAEIFAFDLSADDERQLRDEIAKQDRIAAEKTRVRDAYEANACPQCGRPVRLNLSLTGWVQCSQFGAEQFRADPKQPPCSWQGFFA